MDRSTGERGRPGFGRVVARAAVSPLNLAVAGLSGAAAVALGVWPVAAIGGAAYLALVAWDVASPEFWQKTLAGVISPAPGAHPDRAPDAREVRDPALREAAAAVQRALDELRRVAGEAEGDVAVQVAGLLVSVDELERRSRRLVESGDEIARHLGREDQNAIHREVQRLESRAAAAPDEEARRPWIEATQARREHLRVLADLTTALDRIQANLSRIAASLDGLSAKVVRMGAMDAQAMGDLSGDMNSEIERLNNDVDTFEEALRPLVSAELRA